MTENIDNPSLTGPRAGEMNETVQAKRVLVVEDDEQMREMLQEILRGGGYECSTVESGLRALSVLAEIQDIDLVFSDVDMPGIDGIELLRTVKTLLPSVPVVLVSGKFGSELGVDAVLGGAADYLYKPVRSEAVLDMAERYLGPGSRISEAMFQDSLAALISQNGDSPLRTSQILSLFESLGMKRYETLQHSRRVSDYSVMLGFRHGMAKAELEDLRVGALLHDIGKIAVPHNVLMKPGPLDDANGRSCALTRAWGGSCSRTSRSSAPRRTSSSATTSAGTGRDTRAASPVRTSRWGPESSL